MENSYKTDPPINIPEFLENNFFKNPKNPKNPKNTPKNYKMSKNGKKGQNTFLQYYGPLKYGYMIQKPFLFFKKVKKFTNKLK